MKKPETIAVRIPAALWRKVQRAAKTSQPRVSASALLAWLVERALER